MVSPVLITIRTSSSLMLRWYIRWIAWTLKTSRSKTTSPLLSTSTPILQRILGSEKARKSPPRRSRHWLLLLAHRAEWDDQNLQGIRHVKARMNDRAESETWLWCF